MKANPDHRTSACVPADDSLQWIEWSDARQVERLMTEFLVSARIGRPTNVRD